MTSFEGAGVRNTSPPPSPPPLVDEPRTNGSRPLKTLRVTRATITRPTIETSGAIGAPGGRRTYGSSRPRGGRLPPSALVVARGAGGGGRPSGRSRPRGGRLPPSAGAVPRGTGLSGRGVEPGGVARGEP